MTAIRGAKTSSRDGTSTNGRPELVPYVYRQQERRNSYAARIARRNAEASLRPFYLSDERRRPGG